MKTVVVTFKIDTELLFILDTIARIQQKKRSDIIREALLKYIETFEGRI